jgi:hypothetical protein
MTNIPEDNILGDILFIINTELQKKKTTTEILEVPLEFTTQCRD